METEPGASSIRESGQVVRVLGALVPTLAVDAYMEKHGYSPPFCSELDFHACTPLVQEQESGSLKAKNTRAHNSDGCSVVEGEVVQ